MPIRRWHDYFQYDDQGRLLVHAWPSAVSGYNESEPDLLDADVSGNYVYLSDGSGLVEQMSYHVSGPEAGYYSGWSVQRGEFGAPVPQQDVDYQARLGEDVESTFFDSDGRPIWRKDGDGFLHYTAYDPATGAIVKTITDVNSNLTSDFIGLPAGWVTPAGGGRHRQARMEVDSLGRTTKLTNPRGYLTYTVFNDLAHEMRIYPGWHPTLNDFTGPTQVVRADRPGSYIETLTMSAAPTVDPTTGRPTGQEAISSLETLSRSYTSGGGQIVRTDAYFKLAGLAYATAPYLGTVNVNFYSTLYGYDERGRPNRVATPTGTITRTVFVRRRKDVPMKGK